ncbi:MAG: hypothetical protein WB793_11355 [Candidatus Dormiibacterota bacterium]
MPWAIVIRLLARLAASLFFWRIATNRRRAFAGGQPVPGSTPKARLDAQAAVMAVRASILLTWRALLTATFLASTAVLAIAGVTIVILTPRWLGAVLLAAAIGAGALTWFEGRVLVVALRMRNRRRRDERLRKTATS